MLLLPEPKNDTQYQISQKDETQFHICDPNHKKPISKFGANNKKIEPWIKYYDMKIFYKLVALAAVITIGCQKNKSTPDIQVVHVSAQPPVATFKITNTETGTNSVLEGKKMIFENDSQNGDSYLWDFGNGTTSTEKVPTGIDLWPCTTTVTVTLTVTNSEGKTSTHSEPYYVICARLFGGTHVDHNKGAERSHGTSLKIAFCQLNSI
jgi:hypothetical protein